ncbi:iron chaperone [Chondrinema litorale]|uniref:iron chaperone n=1 Tax=Chondrinema litorale TaxID=2994555 RepID=UPI002542E8F3|nr:DUF1801 domain-containing protein [Chondrinema litorale]UZR99471.1 DUF1801 domain-containing protein [Chondrinema litorale]
MKGNYKNVDEYIATFSEPIKEILEEIRAHIKNTAPQAEEVISYDMPAYKYNGPLVYFAGYKKHIGFYPTPSAIAHFKTEIEKAKYKWAKGSVQFPLSVPMPMELIKEMVLFKLTENTKK